MIRYLQIASVLNIGGQTFTLDAAGKNSITAFK